MKGLLASCTMTASEPHQARRNHRAKCFIKTAVVGNSRQCPNISLASFCTTPRRGKQAGRRPPQGKRERTPPPRSSSGFREAHLSKPKSRASGSPGQQQGPVSELKPLLRSAPARPSLPPPCLGWEMPPPNFCGKAREMSRLRETGGEGGARRPGARAAQMRVRGLESGGAVPRAPSAFRSPGRPLDSPGLLPPDGSRA